MLTTALYGPTELHGLTEAALLLLLYSDFSRSLHSRYAQVRASRLDVRYTQQSRPWRGLQYLDVVKSGSAHRT